MIQLEIAIDSLADGERAIEAGADRLEVCSRLDVGGLTPSFDLFRALRRAGSTELCVMIRPREGSFEYSASEAERMVDAVGEFGSLGADGFVFGGLLPGARPDLELTARLVASAGNVPCIFHRAFDSVKDPLRAVDELARCGVRRILTSGGAPTAEEGISKLRSLVEHARSRVVIMPGGGVRPSNAERILHGTGATEIHSGARSDAGKFEPVLVSLLAGICHAVNHQ